MPYQELIAIGSQVAEVQVVFSHRVKVKDRLQVKNNHTAASIFRHVWDPGKLELLESFKIMLLNRRNDLLGVANISEGGITGCIVDIRLIFAIAIKASATGIILAHNHPSGNLRASQEDIQLTKRIVEAGKILDILVMDHLIITKEDYLSIDQEYQLMAQSKFHSTDGS